MVNAHSQSSPVDHASPMPPDALRLEQLGRGFQVAQAIYTAVRLNVPDLMSPAGSSCTELANAAGASAPALARLLRTLGAFGLVREIEPDRFVLLDTGAALRADHPFSQRQRILFWGSRNMWESWAALVECVRSGRTANAFLHGAEDPQRYFDRHPEDAALFHDAMTARVQLIAVALRQAYDFSSIRRVVDIGGGHGRLLIQLLLAYRNMTGVVFDLPNVVEGAKRAADSAGVANRLEVIGGDLFKDAPPEADVYIMSGVLPNWQDDRTVTALERVSRAMVAKTRLLVIDSFQPEPGDESIAAQTQMLDDLTMLVRTGGRVRRVSELGELLSAAALHVTQVAPLGFMRMVEAVRRA